MSRGNSAVLAIDLINPFDYPGAVSLLRETTKALPTMRRILRRARAAGVPVIYCNDNFGQWRSDFRTNVDHCAAEGAIGAEVVRELVPAPGDYFILKPKHSAFFETPLRILLNQLTVKRIALLGIATDSCILNTALDAHMLEFEVVVVRDAVAAQTPARSRRALEVLQTDRRIRAVAARSVLRWIGA
ncbi:isochorismatase family cysteine hydrolase [Dokdonella sp.]|uniref:isochorismatase family cysteine hydrolase n=1 Tax=Dokdonella sp. TaxID=2291710 RepID=UPI001B095E7B|nr:isochorismatase family cysteine hydrolase [Dokdonella sp.]MBO9664014.1 cysteine hydrolase [Dokdonella sp.]